MNMNANLLHSLLLPPLSLSLNSPSHSFFHSLNHLQQQFADLILALGGRLVQWRELPEVHHIDILHVAYQLLSYIIVAIGAGVV